MPGNDALDELSALADPVRRDLYAYVAASPEPVNRSTAATALGLPVSTAAVHLDRLAEAGLLTVERRRPAGRTGPGAGRPAKLYRRAERDISVSLPPRRYDIMGDLLASAIDAARPDETSRAALDRVAAARGTEHGRASGSLDAVLAAAGYGPVTDDDGTALTNCPFHSLIATHSDVVCAANHAYLTGAAVASGLPAERVRLAPAEGHCCVRIGPPDPGA